MNDVKVLDFRAPKDWPYVDLYPLADWHWGAEQCAHEAVRRHVRRVLDDPYGVSILMGDLPENALITSVGDVYRQKRAPSEQMDDLVALLEPIASKILAVIDGNHEYRTVKVAGLNPDQILATLLGIPNKYMGISCEGLIRVGGDTSWLISGHHTYGGGRTMGAKANLLLRMAEIHPMMDLYLGAHTHCDMSFSRRVFYIETSHALTYREKVQYFSGVGAGLEYRDSYGHRKVYPAAAKCQVMLRLGRRVRARKKSDVPDAIHKPFQREVFHF